MADPEQVSSAQSGGPSPEKAKGARSTSSFSPRTSAILGSVVIAGIVAALLQWLLRDGPSPPPPPLPPSGKIEFPAAGQLVTNRITVRGRVSGIPEGHSVWIAVQVGNHIWMKDPEVKNRPTWQVDVNEGSFDSKELTLQLVVASPEERRRITEWLAATKVPPPFDKAPGMVLDQVVARFVPCLDLEIALPRGALRDSDAGSFCVPRTVAVSWEPRQCPATMQAYNRGALVFQGAPSRPDVSLTLPVGVTELKLWSTATAHTSRWVRVSDSCASP